MGSQAQTSDMYTVAKGPTSIVQKTRRGLSKKLESLETSSRVCEIGLVSPDSLDMGSSPLGGDTPLCVFQPIKGKTRNLSDRTEEVTPQHIEIVTFVNEGWKQVKREMEANKKQGGEATSKRVKYYQEKEPNPLLLNFQPFDLEAWWGKKLYHNLTSGI